MIRRILDFALCQRFVTLALGFALVVLGTVAFQRRPIEAYPDVGDVEVDVITIWSGHAAEEVERYLTILPEQEPNGIARIRSLARVVIGGVVTAMTLLVLPAIYALIARRQARPEAAARTSA